MRPRVFPAEDSKNLESIYPRPDRFNEAAGIPRGRLQSLHLVEQQKICFNEAAGIPRGRPA